ncbi:hypothetical protein LRH25_31340 [Ideonella azotifigens]|uniref:DUF1795 domain-containing protein n=1 Tax=Ideonella azotifigens TaxID=513160 RepID=A0ABN1KLE6_9BURK|nr:hypothetical protein [Ideonella azotifigens]MCD2344819.1 hypothetical protein [Ideonella azotifigens]
MSGCSPALDWREGRVVDASLQFVLPCRPDHHERVLPLAGVPVRLQMQVCEAEGQTFAVSVADMGEPARVGPALQDLRVAFERNLGQPAAAAPSAPAWLPPGATPQPAAGRWPLLGKTPAGEAVHAELALAARGTWVVQATVLARGPLSAEATQVFWEGLRFAP